MPYSNIINFCEANKTFLCDRFCNVDQNFLKKVIPNKMKTSVIKEHQYLTSNKHNFFQLSSLEYLVFDKCENVIGKVKL